MPVTQQQPEALRLADELCTAPERSRTSFEAAAELRRLHAEVHSLKNALRAEEAISFRLQMQMYAAQRDELLEALQAFPGFIDDTTVGDAWVEKMRAAIDKATGDTPCQ